MPALSRSAAFAVLVALVVGLTGCGGAKDSPKGDEKPRPTGAPTGTTATPPGTPTVTPSDAESLQGVWTVHRQESDGERVSIFGDMTMTFKGDKVELRPLGKDHKDPPTAAFKLDPTKSPKEIDLTVSKDGQSEVVRGIYDLKGDDLRICLAEPKAKRPTAFVTVKGGDSDLAVYKRGEVPPPTPSETELKAGIVGKWSFVGGAKEFDIFSGVTEFTTDGRVLRPDPGTKKSEEQYKYRVEKSHLILTPADKKGQEQRIWVTEITPEWLVATSPRGRLKRAK